MKRCTSTAVLKTFGALLCLINLSLPHFLHTNKTDEERNESASHPASS